MKNILKTLPIIVQNGRIALDFNLSDVKAMAIVGVDLVALMRDGSRLLLPGMALKILELPSPELQFEDQHLSGAELFSNVDIDSTGLEAADKALQIPVSEPTVQDPPGIFVEAQAAAPGREDGAADNDGKGAEEPQAWYQQYGWVFGVVGLLGLALGLSSSKKGGGKEDDKPADPPADKPAVDPAPDAGAGSGPDEGAKPAPDAGTDPKPAFQVTGDLAAGVFNQAQTLLVKLYDAQGQQLTLGELAVGADGQVLSYRATLPDDYVGFVRVVVSDGAQDGLGFVDEYRQALALSQGMAPEQAEKLASADFPALNAIGYRSAGQSGLVISVTPLTELVARLLGLPADPTQSLDGALSAEQVTAMTVAVARLASQIASDDAQILDLLGPVMAINANNFGVASQDARSYGRVLAGLTGLDAVSGALENTLHLLTRGLVADADGALHVASSVEGAILLTAMQQANALLGRLVDSSGFERFKLPEMPWANVSVAFTDAAATVSPGLDLVGSDGQPSVTLSWDVSPDRIAAGQMLALYLLDGSEIASHALTQADVDAGGLVLRAGDYGAHTLGEDGVKRLFAVIAGDDGALVARSELCTYGLVSVEVDAITGLSADTGVSPGDFITNQPVQAVSGTYAGTLGPNTHIEVSADGGRTWVAARATPAAQGTGGHWVSDSLRLDGIPPDGESKLLTRVAVSGVDGELPLMLPGASHAFVLDVVPPEAVVTTIDSISAPFVGAALPGSFLFTQASQTIRGTLQGPVTDDDRVMVSIDGGASWVLGNISADGTTWDASVGFSRHGAGEILARINDVAGNATAAMAHLYQFTEAALVGVPPTQAVRIVTATDKVGDPADPYDFTGPLALHTSTDDRRVTLSGTLNAPLEGDQMLVVVSHVNGGGDEHLLGYANVAPPAQEGQLPEWSFTPVSDMALGNHHIEVKVFSPGANAFSPPYPDGVDAAAPDAQSNWGNWDVNVQAITFGGVVVPGLTPVNLLTLPSRVTGNSRPILLGALGAPLLADEHVSLYDAVDGRAPSLIGTAEVASAGNGADVTWRYVFHDDIQLGDGVHQFHAVIERTGPDGVGVPLLGAATPSVVVSTELPDQVVMIDQVLDDVGIYMGAITSDASTDDAKPTLSGRLSAPLRPGQELQVRAEDPRHSSEVLTYRPIIDESGLAWSLAVAPALPVGEYELSAGVVNAGGTMGAGRASFHLRINSLTFSNLNDAVGPITGNVFAGAEPFVTDDRLPILRGQIGVSLAEGERLRIVCTHSGKETLLGMAAVTPNQQGGLSWEFRPDAAPGGQGRLPDGASTLSVQVVDAASGQVRLAVNRVINVDDHTPAERADVTEVRDQVLGVNGFVGPLALTQSTDDRQPLISGVLVGAQALPASRAVQVMDRVILPNGTVSESVLGLATVGADGTWTFRPGDSLALGDHTFSAKVINRANEQSGPVGQTFTIRENQLTFDTVQDAVGALQGNLLDAKLFPQPIYTDDRRPQLAGRLGAQLGPNERISIYDSEIGGPFNLLGTATVNGTHWVFQPAGDLRNGVHGIQARVEQLKGGAQQVVLLAVSTPPITIDGTTTPITQSLLTLAVNDNNGANGSQLGVVPFRASTDDLRPVVSGKLSAALTAGLQLQVFASLNGGAEHKLGVAKTNGVDWTYALTSNLPYGPNTILARVVAVNSGLVSNTLSTTVNVNRITLSGINEAATGLNVLDSRAHGTGDNTVTLRGRLASPLLVPNERVTIYTKEDGEALFTPVGVAIIARNGLDWSFSLPSRGGSPQVWEEGRHEVSVRIEDMASRAILALATEQFTVDTLAPQQRAEITGYQDQAGEWQALITQVVSTDDARGIIRGTIDAPIDSTTRSVVLYDRIDGEWVRLGEAKLTGTNWVFQSPVAFGAGVHSLMAQVENVAAGSRGVESGVFDIHVQQIILDSIVNLAHPDVNILLPSIDGASPQGEFKISGRLSVALAPGEELKIIVDGVTQGACANVDADGLGWSYELKDGERLGNGVHAIAARILDGAGSEQRVTSASSAVNIGDGAPTETVTINAARDNRAVGASFTGDNASGVSSDDPLPLLKGTVSSVLFGGRGVAVYGQMPGQDAPAFLGYATLAANATWTFPVDRELPFGDTVFTARVVNLIDPQALCGPVSAGFIVSEQELSITALVDTTGAGARDLFQFQVAAPAQEQAVLRTVSLRPTLRGSLAQPLKSGETISIFHGNTKLGEALVDTDGVSWTFTPPADIAQGARPFSAVLVAPDGTSLTSAQTPQVVVSALRAGHAVTITSLQDQNNLSGSIEVSVHGVLDDARPFLSGTLAQALNAFEALRVYSVDDAGGRYLLGTAATSGKTWSLKLGVTLPAGASHLQAAIESKAGGDGAVLSVPLDINLVSLSPVSIDGISALDAVASARPTLHASINTKRLDGLSVLVYVDGSKAGTAVLETDGSWRFEIPTDLAPGVHQVSYSMLRNGLPLRAVPASPPTTFTVSSVDAPSFSVRITETGAPHDTDRALTILTGTASEPVAMGMGIMVAINGKDAGLAGLDASRSSWSYPLWAQLPGAYAVTVRPINLATLATLDGGSAQTTILQNQITIEAPAGAMTLPDGAFALLVDGSSDITLSGHLAQALPAGGVLQIRCDGKVLGIAAVSATQWSYQVPVAQQGTGGHRYSVVALPPDADPAGAGIVPTLSTQATLNLIPAGSGPNPLMLVSITGLFDNARNRLEDVNGTIADPLPILRGTVQGIQESSDQVAVFGQATGGQLVRLGVARMLTDTTWEFQVSTPLPQGNYRLTAMPENRLTGVVNDVAEAVARFQVQQIAITEVDDQVGAIRGNVLDKAFPVTDDGTPLIQGRLGAPLRTSQQYLQVSDTVGGVTTVLGRAQVDALNPLAWSFIPSLPLVDGRHTLSVAVMDANTSTVQFEHQVSFIKDASIPRQTVSISIVRDDDGPVVGNVPLNGAISYPRPMVSGTVSAALTNAQVLRIWRDDGNGSITYLGDATVKGTSWSWRSDQDMAFGSVNLFATVENPASAVGTTYQVGDGSASDRRSPTYSFRLQALSDIHVKDPRGNDVGYSTTERHPEISGKLAVPLVNGEYLELSEGTRIVGRATVTGQEWRFVFGESLANGLHNFKLSIKGFGNSSNTPLVFEYLSVNVHEAVPDPLQAGSIEAVIALGAQSLSANSAFDTLMGRSTRPGQSLGSGAIGIFGKLALAPRAGDVVQVFDNGVLLGAASVAGARWWYNAGDTLATGEHRFTLRINEQEVPVLNPVQGVGYPVQVLGADAIRIDDPGSRTDTVQPLGGSLLRALGAGEVLGVYRTLNGETVRLGDAQVQGTAQADGRYAWQFTPSAALALGIGAQTLTVQVEGATHARVAAVQSASILLDESAITTEATILSVSVPRPDGLHSLAPDSRSTVSSLVVNGYLDRALVGTERVALYDGVILDGYATIGANDRNWTYILTGVGNGRHQLTAVVQSQAGVVGPISQPFSLEIVAQMPGQVVTLASVEEAGMRLGIASPLDQQEGFLVFVWNLENWAAYDITSLGYTAAFSPTGQARVPQLNFHYSSDFLPGVPYSEYANYVASGWFYVDHEQAGLWSFRSPVVDDFEIVSVDGARVMFGRSFMPGGITGSILLDVGWHSLRVDAGNTGGRGTLDLGWRAPNETTFHKVSGIQPGPAEQAVALGATDRPHALTLDYALSAPLGQGEALQVVDLTAHRTADGLRLQFWNLPSDPDRTLQDALALTSAASPVVSRMSDSLLYDRSHAYDSGVVAAPFSMVGRATGWFHVEQAEAGTWLFRGASRFDHVLFKIDGHTMLSPDVGLSSHAQYATLHLEAGWHYLDSTLFQSDFGKAAAEDWEISVIRPRDTVFSNLTGFAQFDRAVLGNATQDAQDPTAFSFQTVITDGNSHTLSAAVVGADDRVADPVAAGASGMTFLANGAFGIIDKQVRITGDGQSVHFSREHGPVNQINLDADHAAHVQGNRLVMDSDDIARADTGSAAHLGSSLLDASFHQFVVLGGEHDVLKFDAVSSANGWQESGHIDVSADSHLTVFTNASSSMQLIVDTHIALDLEGALRSSAHPVI